MRVPSGLKKTDHLRMKNYLSKYHDLSAYLLFLALSIIAYWQIALLQYSLQWDMLDCFLPWRYFAGECIQNGQLPLWNPYQHLGYPVYADLRSAWYPEYFILGLTTGYSNITIHFLYIFYISIAGLGMYKLSQDFNLNRSISLITGSAYLLAGFFICHGQDLGFIISASFIPFVFHYYLSLIRKPNLQSLFKAALFILLLIFGGYPAFTLFTIYFLIAIFLTKLISEKIYIDKAAFKRLIISNLSLIVIIIAGSAVLIISYLQIGPWVGRISGLTYEKAALNPFSPQSLLSWILPFGMVKNTSYFATDISMNNAYWGVIMMIFFVLFIFRKKTTLMWLFLFTGVFSLLASFGNYFPLHRFLFNYIPGMNVFRMPSFFSYFTILTFIILSGTGIQSYLNNPDKHRKRLLYITISALLMYLVIVIFSFIYKNSDQITEPNNFRELIRSLDLHQHFIIQSLIQIIILVAFILFIYKKIRVEKSSGYILGFVILEMIISVQLNMHFTGVSEANPLQVRQFLQTKPSGFPLPPDEPVCTFTERASQSSPLWRNVNIFSKKPGFDGFNSFVLDNLNYLYDSLPQLKEEILKNKLIYFSDKLLPVSDIKLYSDSGMQSNYLFVTDSVFNKFKDHHFKTSTDDNISLKEFSPHNVKISYQSERDQIITILQSDFTGWKSFIDDKPVNHITSNILFKSVVAPAGKHDLIFKYDNKPVKAGFYLSYFIIISLLAGLLIIYYRRLKIKNQSR